MKKFSVISSGFNILLSMDKSNTLERSFERDEFKLDEEIKYEFLILFLLELSLSMSDILFGFSTFISVNKILLLFFDGCIFDFFRGNLVFKVLDKYLFLYFSFMSVLCSVNFAFCSKF